MMYFAIATCREGFSGDTGASGAETDDTRPLTRCAAGSIRWPHRCGRDG